MKCNNVEETRMDQTHRPCLCVLQYGRSDSYRVATTQDKDEKESPKKKGGKDLDDLKKEVPIVSTLLPTSCDVTVICHIILFHFTPLGVPDTST